MSADQSEEPRDWTDNHPWCQWHCGSTDDDGRLVLGEKRLEIRWVFQAENHKEELDNEIFFFGLAYDRAGNFYAFSEFDPKPPLLPRKCLVRKLSGKDALTWFAKNAAWDTAFARELCRAIDNPHFEFMSLVPVRTPAKRKRKAQKCAEAFHEQLHLATALVECVRKLEAEPTLANLSDACRSAAKVHSAIHAPENFKLAANA